jgi:hypothetical protein
MKALLDEGTRIQKVVEEGTCTCRAVQYYKSNMHGIGKIEKEIYEKSGKALL